MHVKSKLLHIFSYLTQFTIFILPESEHLAPQNLAVHRGEVVRVTQIEGAWTECTNSDGETGWVPSLYLRLVIAHSNEFAPPPAESWQASSLDDKSEDKATKHRMTSRALEQLASALVFGVMRVATSCPSRCPSLASIPLSSCAIGPSGAPLRQLASRDGLGKATCNARSSRRFAAALTPRLRCGPGKHPQDAR
jgi:hypothetical protein